MRDTKTNTYGKSVLGYVDYDSTYLASSSNQCYVVAHPGADLRRGVFVKIGSPSSYFMAQIVDGPYHTREGEARGFKTRYVAELSAFLEEGVPKAVLTRPKPGMAVEPVESQTVRGFLGVSGGMRLGCLSTDRGIDVTLDPSTLTRHVGVFGTTGSGKSNTIQVLMEEACSSGLAVLVFDVEGEYVEMDKPAGRLTDVLAGFGLKPKAVEDLKVYVPYPSSSSRVDAVRFGIRFKDVERDVFSEVAGLTRMEHLYFQDLIEKVEAVTPSGQPVTLKAVVDRLESRLKALADNPTMPPFIAEAHTTLYGKLSLTLKLNIVDVKAPSVKMEEVFKAGRVSVVDFSDASDHVRNIVIADLLHKAFRYKIAHPDSPRLFIVVEEAHAFISREKRDRMLATLMLVVETARRGRKRGLCLGIVTQQPNHLPSELLELCNTRIMHRMSSTANINVLKESTGNVPEGMWSTVPSLGRGEAVISTPKYSRALLVTVRPSLSERIASE
ncbi:MAG: ATP-binding protein [Candidatus Bathyarchaeia archaeon]